MFRLALRGLLNNRRGSNKERSDAVLVTSRWCHSRYVDGGNVELLVRLLHISEAQASEIVGTYGTKITSDYQIVKSHELCVAHGIDNETLSKSPSLLFFRPSHLEQRIHFLKDAGCRRISPDIITTFLTAVNLSVSQLKLDKVLPRDADVPRNLLSCLDLPRSRAPSAESFTEDLTLSFIYEIILQRYVEWKFELTKKQLDTFMKSRLRKRHQSLTLIRRMIHILLSECGVSKNRLMKNCAVITRSPGNAEQILNEVRYIGDTEAKIIVNRQPRIFHLSADVLRKKMQVLKEQGIRDAAISNCPEILVFSSENVIKRIAEFHSIPQLKGFWSHPRVLVLIMRLPLVKKRMAILGQLNVRCASLHILCMGATLFNRFILVGSDSTKGRDLLKFLSYELDVDQETIHASMTRHVYWCKVPFLHVQETFSFLKEQKYPNEAILDNIQIVLYRRSLIEQELNNIDSKKDECWDLTPSRKLALCLYNIEKEYHFDGNGVWNCEKGSTEEERDSQSNRNSIVNFNPGGSLNFAEHEIHPTYIRKPSEKSSSNLLVYKYDINEF